MRGGVAGGAGPAADGALEQLCEGAAELHLKPAWEDVVKAEAQVEPSPVAAGEAYRWEWDVLRTNVLKAAELLAQQATADDPRLRGAGWERRAFFLSNPRFPDSGRTTHTLAVAVQCMLPGDVGPCHRHTATALRFVVEGQGAFTSVDGEPVYMEPGDLMLTPSMTWHDNLHEGDGPMVWMDYLDIPLVGMLGALFFEPLGVTRQNLTKPAGWSRRYGGPSLRPAHEPLPAHNPLLLYPWAETERALAQAAATGADEYDGTILEYVDQRDGGPISPTLDACVAQLAGGAHTKSHRHTSSVAYHVRSGRGTTVADGKPIEWRQGDLFVVPGWQWHEHLNGSESEPAVLVSVSDRPALGSLGLYREQAYPGGDGRQPSDGSGPGR